MALRQTCPHLPAEAARLHPADLPPFHVVEAVTPHDVGDELGPVEVDGPDSVQPRRGLRWGRQPRPRPGQQHVRDHRHATQGARALQHGLGRGNGLGLHLLAADHGAHRVRQLLRRGLGHGKEVLHAASQQFQVVAVVLPMLRSPLGEQQDLWDSRAQGRLHGRHAAMADHASALGEEPVVGGPLEEEDVPLRVGGHELKVGVALPGLLHGPQHLCASARAAGKEDGPAVQELHGLAHESGQRFRPSRVRALPPAEADRRARALRQEGVEPLAVARLGEEQRVVRGQEQRLAVHEPKACGGLAQILEL
mmetsp:Transcript_78624/g.243957  ORF Transcript_78624/g.243957 Transcript_78624/m.243957 type:complete len:308 (-) Transcript_78624:1156-2079(-)